VALDTGRGRLRIASLEGAEDQAVMRLGHGLPFGGVAEHAHRQGAAQVPEDRQELPRATGVVDEAMELEVERHLASRFGGRLHLLVQLLQTIEARLVDALGAPAGRHPGHHAVDTKVVDDVVGVEFDHECAAARDGLDQAFLGQLDQRLAHREAADAQRDRDLVLIHFGSGTELSREDLLADEVGRGVFQVRGCACRAGVGSSARARRGISDTCRGDAIGAHRGSPLVHPRVPHRI
jgi:hypothetical protein